VYVLVFRFIVYSALLRVALVACAALYLFDGQNTRWRTGQRRARVEVVNGSPLRGENGAERAGGEEAEGLEAPPDAGLPSQN
jgi:hypothetical protein